MLTKIYHWYERIFAILGLIVGAIIRYSSRGSTLTSEVVVLPDNTTFGWGDPPDNLKLTIALNGSHRQYFQYNYKAQISEKKVDEKELEEKVSHINLLQ